MIRINLVRGKRKKRREFNVDVAYLVVPILVLAGTFYFPLAARGGGCGGGCSRKRYVVAVQ